MYVYVYALVTAVPGILSLEILGLVSVLAQT